MTIGEAKIGVLAVGVDDSTVDTPVDVGFSATIDTDGRVAKEVGRAVGWEVAPPHPASENIANTNVTDGSNNLLLFIDLLS